MTRRPPSSTLSPYTTLFRSQTSITPAWRLRPTPSASAASSAPWPVFGSLERSEEHTSELQSPCNLVCRLLLEKKKEVHTTWIEQVQHIKLIVKEVIRQVSVIRRLLLEVQQLPLRVYFVVKQETPIVAPILFS